MKNDLFPRAASSASGFRILVVLSAHVGRNLFCTPALALLRRRWPTARVDVLVGSSRGAAVLEGNPHVDGIRFGRGGLALRWHARRADLVLGLCGRGTRSLRRRPGRRVCSIGPLPGREHRADEVLDFVGREIGLHPTDRDRRYVLAPRRAEHERAAALVPDADGWRTIGIHLGSGKTQAHGWKTWYAGRDADPRLWGIERYVELARRLATDAPRTRFVLTGAPSEAFLAKPFAAAVPYTIDLVGRTTVLEMAAVMTRLDAFLSGDTGPMHVAAAMNTPLVALFGPTDPRSTGPYPARRHHEVVTASSTAMIDAASIADILKRVIREGCAVSRPGLDWASREEPEPAHHVVSAAR